MSKNNILVIVIDSHFTKSTKAHLNIKFHLELLSFVNLIDISIHWSLFEESTAVEYWQELQLRRIQ